MRKKKVVGKTPAASTLNADRSPEALPNRRRTYAARSTSAPAKQLWETIKRAISGLIWVVFVTSRVKAGYAGKKAALEFVCGLKE